MGATVKTSDLVGQSGQVPDFGQVGQVAPQLFDLSVGNISGPINAGRTGVVVKIIDKQEPSADEIAKNFDQTRDQILEQRRAEPSTSSSAPSWTTTKSTSAFYSTPKPRPPKSPEPRPERKRIQSKPKARIGSMRAFSLIEPRLPGAPSMRCSCFYRMGGIPHPQALPL